MFTEYFRLDLKADMLHCERIIDHQGCVMSGIITKVRAYPHVSYPGCPWAS